MNTPNENRAQRELELDPSEANVETREGICHVLVRITKPPSCPPTRKRLPAPMHVVHARYFSILEYFPSDVVPTARLSVGVLVLGLHDIL